MAGEQMWGWYPAGNKWVKLQVDEDGSIHIVGYVDKLDDIGDVNVPAPGDGEVLYWDNAAGKWQTKTIEEWGAAEHTAIGDDAPHHAKYLDAEAVAAVEAAGLTLAALKKIIFANDGLAQFGVLDGSPEVFGGEATQPQVLFVRPKDGNREGEIIVLPSGTNTHGNVGVANSQDPENFGSVSLVIEDLSAYIHAWKVGTGDIPTVLKIDVDTVPLTSVTQGLGNDDLWWKHVKAAKHNMLSTVTAAVPVAGFVADDLTAGEGVVLGDAVYMKNDGKVWKSDADLATTMPIIALAAETVDADAAGQFLHQGYIYKAAWDWTIGGIIYASVTPGELTQIAPVGSGDQVQVVGVAITADIIHFNPSYELVEIS